VWLSSAVAGAGHVYHATQICNLLGYSTVAAYGGNFGDTCSYGTAGSSCTAPGLEKFDGSGKLGTDSHGLEVGSAVMWSCNR
jgi:hypothetical protein